MSSTIKSISLLRNGKVYPTKSAALRAFGDASTSGPNDGVAKLSRYLDADNNVKTIVGFYANAGEMEDAHGGNSFYTVFDIEGLSGETKTIENTLIQINDIIGEGISGQTLTQVINNITNVIGGSGDTSGFSSGFTIYDAYKENSDKIGSGFSSYTITEVINNVYNVIGSGDTSGFSSGFTIYDAYKENSDKIGSGFSSYTFSSAFTIVDALEMVKDELIKQLTVEGGSGITISYNDTNSANTITVNVAEYSDVGVENIIYIDDTDNSLKSKTNLDCGYFD